MRGVYPDVSKFTQECLPREGQVVEATTDEVFPHLPQIHLAFP